MQQLRIDLATSLRWAARLGLSEGICNHFSAVLPDDPKKFLINPLGKHWSQISPVDLVLVDNAGQPVDGRVETTALSIHRGIHLNKPNAKAVLHTHMPYAATLTCLMNQQLQFIHQNSLRFYNRIAYDETYNGLALNLDEGERIASKLEGDCSVLFLANHGVIICGRSVAEAFDDLYYLERACQLQVLAMGTGQKLRFVEEKVAELTSKQMQQEAPPQARLHLMALQRILDDENPLWRTEK